MYGELHRIAEVHMARQQHGHTLQTTALVNEAYMKLAGRDAFADHSHFIRVASRAMRQILIDHARHRHTRKRDAAEISIEVDDVLSAYEERAGGLLDLDAALTRLEKRDPKLAELIELRFFGGRSMEEVAELMGISERKAHRWWNTARLFLKGAMDER